MKCIDCQCFIKQNSEVGLCRLDWSHKQISWSSCPIKCISDICDIESTTKIQERESDISQSKMRQSYE